MSTNAGRSDSWGGWIAFAGMLLVMVGTFNGIIGLTALLKDEVYLVGEAGLIVFDYTTFGWIHLVLGLAILLVGVGLLTHNAGARVIAIILVILNATAQMAFLTAYPYWALLIIALDVLVLYALTARWNEPA